MTNEELQQAIAWFENRISSATMPGARKMFGIALSALREKIEREKEHIGEANEMIAKPANEPLTLDELREMDGEPVWCAHRAPVKFGEPWEAITECMIVNAKLQFLRGANRSVPFEALSPSEAIAYRNKPKEDANG